MWKCVKKSENIRETESLYFFLESTKKKVFEKSQNVLKWIKSVSKWINDHHTDEGGNWYDAGGRRDEGCRTKEIVINLGRQKVPQSHKQCQLKTNANRDQRCWKGAKRIGQFGRIG